MFNPVKSGFGPQSGETDPDLENGDDTHAQSCTAYSSDPVLFTARNSAPSRLGISIFLPVPFSPVSPRRFACAYATERTHPRPLHPSLLLGSTIHCDCGNS